MEHGRLVIFTNNYGNSPYITVRYEDYYLFLSMDNLNRREDFVAIVRDEYKTLNANVKDLMIAEIVDMHIEENDYECIEVGEYLSGMILKEKISGKYYSVIITHKRDAYDYYLIDLETFKLTKLRTEVNGKDSDEQFEYVKRNYYTYDFNFCDLNIRIKRR